MTPDELLRLIEAKVILGLETAKLDFKREFSLKPRIRTVALLKLISAIANTDSDQDDGYGFIIYGATGGTWVGNVSEFRPDRIDNLSASLAQKAREYLFPAPDFFILSCAHPTGHGGAIVIPPSNRQPHQFIREFSDDDLRVRRGEWYIRSADSTDLAQAEDFNRVFVKQVARATEPLRTELADVQTRLLKLETVIVEQGQPPKLEIFLLGDSEATEHLDVPRHVSPIRGHWAWDMAFELRNLSAVAGHNVAVEIAIDSELTVSELTRQRLVERQQQRSQGLPDWETLMPVDVHGPYVDETNNMLFDSFNLIRPKDSEFIRAGCVYARNPGSYSFQVAVKGENLPTPIERELKIVFGGNGD